MFAVPFDYSTNISTIKYEDIGIRFSKQENRYISLNYQTFSSMERKTEG